MDKAFKIAVILSAYDKMSTIVNAAVGAATGKMGKVKHFAHELSEVSERAAIAGEGIMRYTEQAIDAAEQSERVGEVAKQVWKNMGDVTGKAAEEAEHFAKAYGPTVGKTHEEVAAVQSKLAIFKHLSSVTGRTSGMFDRATKAAFNFAANGMGEASSNSLKLGKALENPIKYTKSLARMGVVFSDQEMKKIKVLQQTGHLYKAQEIIMTALEKKSKGLAEKNALASDKIKAKWHEAQISLGQKLLPTYDKFIDKLSELITKVVDFSNKHPKLVKWIALSGAALLAFGVIGKIVAFGMNTVASTVRFAGTAFKLFGNVIGTVGRFMMANPILIAIIAIAAAAYLIYTNWDKIKAFFIRLWNYVKGLFSKTWQWIKNMFLNYTPHGLIIKHWDKIKAWFINLWNRIKEIFMNHVHFVMGLGAKFYNAGKNIILSIWNGIKNLVNKPIEAIKNMVAKIRKFLPFSPAKEGALKDIHKIRLVETIAESIKVQPVVQAMHRVGNAIFNTGPSNRMQLAGIGGGGNNFNINITLHGGATTQDGAMVSKQMKETVLGILKEEDNRKKRTSF